MVIQVDSREKAKMIEGILSEFTRQGIDSFISKLPVGDYMSLDNARLVVDRKHNLGELCTNVNEQRFKDEISRAKKFGIKLVILCEHGGDIKSMQDVFYWENPRRKKNPSAMKGQRLYRTLCIIARKHDVTFEFCNRDETGRRIIEILSSPENTR